MYGFEQLTMSIRVVFYDYLVQGAKGPGHMWADIFPERSPPSRALTRLMQHMFSACGGRPSLCLSLTDGTIVAFDVCLTGYLLRWHKENGALPDHALPGGE